MMPENPPAPHRSSSRPLPRDPGMTITRVAPSLRLPRSRASPGSRKPRSSSMRTRSASSSRSVQLRSGFLAPRALPGTPSHHRSSCAYFKNGTLARWSRNQEKGWFRCPPTDVRPVQPRDRSSWRILARCPEVEEEETTCVCGSRLERGVRHRGHRRTGRRRPGVEEEGREPPGVASAKER